MDLPPWLAGVLASVVLALPVAFFDAVESVGQAAFGISGGPINIVVAIAFLALGIALAVWLLATLTSDPWAGRWAVMALPLVALAAFITPHVPEYGAFVVVAALPFAALLATASLAVAAMARRLRPRLVAKR